MLVDMLAHIIANCSAYLQESTNILMIATKMSNTLTGYYDNKWIVSQKKIYYTDYSVFSNPQNIRNEWQNKLLQSIFSHFLPIKKILKKILTIQLNKLDNVWATTQHKPQGIHYSYAQLLAHQELQGPRSRPCCVSKLLTRVHIHKMV